MPRLPRIDAPGMVHHVIARGIERSRIFLDDEDRDFFLKRLGELVVDTGCPVYAFALIPNHFHLLVRSGKTPLSTLMRRLLTSYAGYFNRKHYRSGHLFQNRYKSVPCRDEAYFVQLVRYINLNPVRAGLCSYPELARYRYGAHSYLLGKRNLHWLAAGNALSLFGKSHQKAKKVYVEFVEAGLNDVNEVKDDSTAVQEPEDIHFEPNESDDPSPSSRQRCLIYEKRKNASNQGKDINRLFEQTCLTYDVTREELLGRSKTRRITIARASLAKNMSKHLGMTSTQIAVHLAVKQPAVTKMITRQETN